MSGRNPLGEAPQEESDLVLQDGGNGEQSVFTAWSSACSPADARRRAVEYLRAHCPQADLEAVQLVLSELVTNAVRHTPEGVWSLALHIGESALTLEVSDASAFVPQPRGTLPLDGRGGLGLGIVKNLSDHVITQPMESGKKIVAQWRLAR
ncbi:ATP-binding protein [Streptomyces sp. NPDC046985]|uniref:ATP-binding protein n=1 Tax=Streptomyces sp. NPDC046985 TaxID=3155377 RepID=UPI0033E4FAEB